VVETEAGPRTERRSAFAGAETGRAILGSEPASPRDLHGDDVNDDGIAATLDVPDITPRGPDADELERLLADVDRGEATRRKRAWIRGIGAAVSVLVAVALLVVGARYWTARGPLRPDSPSPSTTGPVRTPPSPQMRAEEL